MIYIKNTNDIQEVYIERETPSFQHIQPIEEGDMDLSDYATIEYVNNQDAMIEESIILLNTDYSHTKERLSALGENVTTLGNDVSAIENDVNTLGDNIGTLEGNINTFDRELDLLGENVTLLEGRVSSLEENSGEGGGEGGEVAKVICVNDKNFNTLEERQEAFTYFMNLNTVNSNPYKYKLVYKKSDKEFIDFYAFKIISSTEIFLYYVDKYKVTEEYWKGSNNFTSTPYTTFNFVREDKLKDVLNTKKIYINETYIYKEETNKFYSWNGSTETEKNINTILNAYIKNDKSIYQLCYTYLNVIFVEKGKTFSYNNCPLYKISSFEKVEEHYDAYGRYHFVGKGETKDLIIDYHYGEETQETIVYERKNVYELNSIWDDAEQSYMVSINEGLRDAFLNGARVILVIEGKLYEITKVETNQFSTSLILNEDGLGAKAYQINVIEGIGKVNEININFN